MVARRVALLRWRAQKCANTTPHECFMAGNGVYAPGPRGKFGLNEVCFFFGGGADFPTFGMAPGHQADVPV